MGTASPSPVKAFRLPFLPLFGAITAVYLLHVALYNYISDDTFIALRYADHCMHGRGLVFNLGDRVEGFTSLLWVGLLSACGALGVDLLSAARALGVLSGLMTLLLAYLLARRIPEPHGASAWAYFAPLMLALNGPFACWAASGLEPPLYAALATGVVCSLAYQRGKTACALAALCLLCRPEAVAFIAVIVLLMLISRKAWPAAMTRRLLIVGGMTTVALFSFRLLYFKAFLPNTYHAKIAWTGEQVLRGLAYFQDYAQTHEGLLLICLPAAYFFFQGKRAARLTAAAAIVSWGITILVGGDGLPMYRFALPAVLFILVLQGAVLEYLYRQAAALRPRTSLMIIGMTVATLGLFAFVNVRPFLKGQQYELYDYQKRTEIPRWIAVGRWFNKHAHPQESIAVVPVGAISYYSGLKIYDMLGLTDRHIAMKRVDRLGSGWAGHEKTDAAYILLQKPTYLLLGNVDVTPGPRDPQDRPFLPYTNPNIWNREKDMFDSDLLYLNYVPQSIEISPGQYLNMFVLKSSIPSSGGSPSP